MNNIIFCEGFDDALILGYYLHKTDDWMPEKDGKISELYDFPKVNPRNQLIDVYKKGNKSLAVWSVGGKDNFKKPFKFLKKINEQHPEQGFQQVFILSDRDNSEIEDCLEEIEDKMKNYGLPVSKLKNNQCNHSTFIVDDETYRINFVPIIIPFEESGALETILLKAISGTSEEDKYIVEEAKEYVDTLLKSDKMEKYLQHERQVLKAKFSSVISITNPDRSTSKFDKLLMSHPWHEKDSIKKHFKILNDLL